MKDTIGYIPWSKSDTAGYLLIYSVKRTLLIGRRPLSPCLVRKTAGYTLPRLLFPRTVPRFSEMYPDLAGSGTLPSAIFSARITFRSRQSTPKPKSPCSKQAMSTGIACLGGRSAPTKEHQNTNSSYSRHTMPPFYSVERTICVAAERGTKGHTNPNLPAWQPALLVQAGGPLLPKNTKTSTLPLEYTMPLFYSVERTIYACLMCVFAFFPRRKARRRVHAPPCTSRPRLHIVSYNIQTHRGVKRQFIITHVGARWVDSGGESWAELSGFK